MDTDFRKLLWHPEFLSTDEPMFYAMLFAVSNDGSLTSTVELEFHNHRSMGKSKDEKTKDLLGELKKSARQTGRPGFSQSHSNN